MKTVERIVKFPKKDSAPTTDKSLIIFDDNVVYKCTEEFPIVEYRCNEESSLNALIKSVKVIKANSCKRFSFYGWESRSLDRVAYFKDTLGHNNFISSYEIGRFLLEKPSLVISSEDLLIFFTENKILVTPDFKNYALVNEIFTGSKKITSIDVKPSYCIVNLEYRVSCDEKGNPIKDSCKLTFTVDDGTLKPIVE